MNIRVVADSTCDLPVSIAKSNHITVIPTCINIGNKTYLDGIDMSRDQFYENLPNFPATVQTSAPGPDAFIQTYEKLAGEGAEEIISIHPPKRLSNLFNVAQLAAGAIKGVRVTALDLGQVSLGTGLLAVKAAMAARAGERLDAIIKMLLDCASQTHLYAALETMEYLRRSGRVPGILVSIGSLLHIKPVVAVYKGDIALTKNRTIYAATEYIIRQIKSLGALDQVAFIHTHARKRVEDLMHSVKEIIPLNPVPLVVEVTPVLGAHVGTGAVGMVAITK